MDLGNDTEKETGWAYGGNGCQATENHVRDENDQSVLVDGVEQVTRRNRWRTLVFPLLRSATLSDASSRKTGEPADRMTFVITQRGNRVAGGGGES